MSSSDSVRNEARGILPCGIFVLPSFLQHYLVESHGRKMYLEFTHSQTFETFARCHLHAFQFFGGVTREIWFDNLATAVAEHDGNLVRFNPRLLSFARECSFIPRTCHVRAPWEKAYASYCTSCEPQTMFFGNRRRFSSLTPCAFRAGLDPGSSYSQSSRSLTG